MFSVPKNIGIDTKIKSLAILEPYLWPSEISGISRRSGEIDQRQFGALLVGILKCGLHHRVPSPRKPTYRHKSHASICYSSRDITDSFLGTAVSFYQNLIKDISRTRTDRNMGLVSIPRFSRARNTTVKTAFQNSN